MNNVRFLAPPFFSVIMNVYNGAPFLRPALDSVMAQTFQDWELIFWDDCSTDASADILHGYHDERIRYFRAPRHVPLAEARNQATGVAKAPWLAFLDQDDLWFDSKLQKQHQLIQERNDPKLAIVYGRGLKFDRRGHVWEADHRHDHIPLPEGKIFRELIVNACFIVMSSAVLRASAAREVGGIPAQFSFCPDYYFYLALARNFHAASLQEPCCWYRVHQQSLSSSNAAAVHAEILCLIDRFASDIPPRLLRRRRNVHQTLIGVSQILDGRSIEGIKHIFRAGSLSYLLSRPFVRAGRMVRGLIKNTPRHTCPSWE